MQVEHGNCSAQIHKEESNMHSQLIRCAQISDFNKIMLEAVDEGLSLLGACLKQALYSHIEKTLKIEKEDIPDKIEEFTCTIERIFGQSAKLLEIEIMKNLYKRVGPGFEYTVENDDLIFIEYVKAVRASARIFEKVSSSLHKLT